MPVIPVNVPEGEYCFNCPCLFYTNKRCNNYDVALLAGEKFFLKCPACISAIKDKHVDYEKAYSTILSVIDDVTYGFKVEDIAIKKALKALNIKGGEYGKM